MLANETVKLINADTPNEMKTANGGECKWMICRPNKIEQKTICATNTWSWYLSRHRAYNIKYWRKCDRVEWTSGARWRQIDLVDRFALLPKDYVWFEGLVIEHKSKPLSVLFSFNSKLIRLWLISLVVDTCRRSPNPRDTSSRTTPTLGCWRLCLVNTITLRHSSRHLFV